MGHFCYCISKWDKLSSIVDTFIKRLREERKACGYTQKQMAELLGIPRSTYVNYETFGVNHRDPDLEMLLKIATVLDTTTDYLLGKDL